MTGLIRRRVTLHSVKHLVPRKYRYYVRSYITRLFAKRVSNDEFGIDSELLTYIRDVYTPKIEAVGKLMGRSLGEWQDWNGFVTP